MRLHHLTLFCLLAACAQTPVEAPQPSDTTDEEVPFTEADLEGTWESGCVDPGNGQGFTLQFDLTDSAWDLDYTTHTDASCADPFMTVHIEGPYELGSASAAVDGAREGTFGFTAKSVTPHSAAAAGFLASADGCDREGFVAGESADLSTGCAGIGQYPLADCSADYDLVHLEESGLRFGARPADNNMCTPQARPTEMSPLYLQSES